MCRTACNHYLSKQFQIYLQLVRTHFHSLFYGFSTRKSQQKSKVSLTHYLLYFSIEKWQIHNKFTFLEPISSPIRLILRFLLLFHVQLQHLASEWESLGFFNELLIRWSCLGTHDDVPLLRICKKNGFAFKILSINVALILLRIVTKNSGRIM